MNLTQFSDKELAIATTKIMKILDENSIVLFEICENVFEGKKLKPSDRAILISYISKNIRTKPELKEKVFRKKKQGVKAAVEQGNKIQIFFDYDRELIDRIKASLQGVKWNSQHKCWYADKTIHNIQTLEALGFKLSPSLIEEKKSFIKSIKFPIKGELLDFQKEGVIFVEEHGGRALIADEMGLGKTVQAITWCELHPELRPVLIICPATLKYQWTKEIQKFVKDPTIFVISGYPKKEVNFDEFLYVKGNTNNIYIIINYDILADRKQKTYDKLKKKHKKTTIPGSGWAYHLQNIPKIVILDECHYIKNYQAQRTKATLRIAKKCKHIIALSGTPITNRPIEFYPVLKLLQPNLFGTRHEFGIKYCDGKFNGFGWDYSGASNIEELNEILTKHVMIRRRKADVLKELPPKQRTVIPFEIKNKKEYIKAKIDFINWLKEKDPESVRKALKAITLVKIEKLKQIAVKGKMNSVINWLQDTVETGEKVVVFCIHKETIKQLMKHFPQYENGRGNAVYVYGDVKSEERFRRTELFQHSPDVRMFVGTIDAASEGITLTASSTVVFVELPWTPAQLQQAEDRVHRISQTNPVNIYYMIAKDTVEEDIMETLDEKIQVVSQLLDGQSVSEEDLLTALYYKLIQES